MTVVTVVRDTFTGADATEIVDHLPEIGELWVPFRESSFGGTFVLQKLSGNTIVTTTTDALAAFNSASPPSADYDVSFDLTIPVGTPPVQQASLFARRIDTANFYQAVYYQSSLIAGGVGTLRIEKYVASVRTILATIADDIGGAGVQTYRFSLVGTTLEVYRGGVLKLTTTDGALTAAGHAGFGLHSAVAGNAVDNFLVEATTTATLWATIRDGMKARITTISGLSVHDIVPSKGTSDKNIAIVVYGEPFLEQSGHQTMIDVHLRVVVRVIRATVEDMQNAMDAYIWPIGTNSIIAAIQAEPTLGGIVDDVQWQGTGSIGPLQSDESIFQATLDFRCRVFYS